MGVEIVGRHMPARITLDDLAAMAAADRHGYRYELSPEGSLSVAPPLDVEHATVASRLLVWFVAAGMPVERVLQAVGIRIPRGGGVGGRVPDLTVWSQAPGGATVWTPATGLLLVVEIVSPGSEAIDQEIKRDEYRTVGIPHYWLVDQDAGHTVTMFRLIDGEYQVVRTMSLTWLLNGSPTSHLG